jgi:outer membrane protein TolC
MLTLIKLIHMLNRRIARSHTHSSRGQVKRTILHGRGSANEHQTAIRFQTICAMIALGLGGWGQIATARATSLDLAGIRQNLQLSVSHHSGVDDRYSIDSSSVVIAQKITPTPVAPDATIKSPNDLNIPKAGGEVQITGRQAITLQQAIEIAFRNNRQVQVARLNVDRDRQSISAAQAAQAVQVGLTGSLQNQGSPLIIGTQSRLGTNTDSAVQGGLQATYSILSAGRNQSSVRAAEEQVKFDQLDLVRVEQLVRGNVITAYFDLQAADSSIIINQAAVRDATRSLSDAQLQERAGVGTRFDVLTAQVQLATANQNLTNAQGQQQTARKNLAQLLVVDNNTEFTAADAVGELGTWRYSLEDSIVLAFKNRPELEQQLTQRRISQQQQIVAAAADSAQVNLFANYTLGKSLTASTSAQDNYSLGAQLSWNFLDGGAAGANSNREKVNQTISENQFTSQRNLIRFQVEQAYFSLGSSQKNIATSTQALSQAEESLKLARLRFQAGVGTQTDVINAQTALATARGNRITAILNYNRALASLRTATVIAE